MATITMDYEEYESLLADAKHNREELKKLVDIRFEQWKDSYKRQNKHWKETQYRQLLFDMCRKRTRLNLCPNMFGRVKYEDALKYFEEVEEMVRERVRDLL